MDGEAVSLDTAGQVFAGGAGAGPLGCEDAFEVLGVESATQVFVNTPGVPVADAIDIYIDVTGALPTSTELDRFARDSSFALARRPPGKKWIQLRDEVLADRGAAGKSVPEAPLPRSERSIVAPPELLSERQVKRRSDRPSTREECLQSLDDFDNDAKVKGRRTQKRYDAWVRSEKEQGRARPWSSHFNDHGGYSALLEEARQRRRRKAA